MQPLQQWCLYCSNSVCLAYFLYYVCLWLIPLPTDILVNFWIDGMYVFMHAWIRMYGTTRSYALVPCIAKIHQTTPTYKLLTWPPKASDSSISLDRNLPERLWILSVPGFTLGLVGSRTTGQTTMGRVFSGDVARAVTTGRRALEFLWVGLYLRAICTRATRQTANTQTVWDSYSLARRRYLATCCRPYQFRSVPWRAIPP